MGGNEADFGGAVAQGYDRDMGPIFFLDYAVEIAQRVSASAPGRILETACGTGIVTRALRDAMPSTHLTATDLNADMMAVAQTKFQPDEQVDFQAADATTLPFPDASFDAVVCQFGMMFYPDKDKGFQEAHRVLLPRGRYHFSVWDGHQYNAAGRIATTVVASFFPTDPPRFYEIPFHYHLIDPIKQSLHAAGFDGMVATVLRHERQMTDFNAFARGLVFGSPVMGQIHQRGGVEPQTIQTAIAAALRQEFGAEPTRMPLQAILFEARKLA